MKTLHLRAYCAVLALGWTGVAGVAPAQGEPAYNTPADFNGTRAVAAVGLQTNEADWTDAELEWNIVNNGNGTFTYSYIFKNIDRPAISHVTLDISDGVIQGEDPEDNPGLVTDLKINGVLLPDPQIEFGDKDGITGAVKLDEGDPETVDGMVTYSFISNRSPVWGHIFLKGGSSSTLTNTGFGDETLENSGHYVARPDSLVPEPAGLVLSAVALSFFLSLAVRLRHRV